MTDKEEIKKAVKNYQGKYFKGKEINNSDTYLYIKKVSGKLSNDYTFFDTYVNVIYKNMNNIVLAQNRRWKFGPYHINQYDYNEISKSVFNKVLKQYGFTINKHSTDYKVERKPINM